MKKIFTVLLLLGVLNFSGLDMLAKLSPYSTAWLDNHAAKKMCATRSASKVGAVKVNSLSSVASAVDASGVEYVGVFVKVASLDVVAEIEALGANVDMAKGSIVAARVPVDMVVALSQLDGVSGIEIEREVFAQNDMARVKTNADNVHSGAGDLRKGYKGQGVLVGICDQGIDFNNISFMDENGVSRVKRAYLPDSESGVAPTLLDGTLLVGSAYDNPIEIASLTTDTYVTHGTHVSGIAVGSYMENDFYGMAPESDLILCGIYSLTDYNLVCAVSYAMDQADRMDKPISVNLSIGNTFGPHDETSYVCQAFDELVGVGKILTLAAGNNGSDKLYVGKEFTSTDNSLKTLLVDYEDGYAAYAGYYDMWSRTDDVIGARIFVYNFVDGKVVYESKLFNPTTVSDLERETINTDDYPELAKYYEGTVEFYSEINDNNNKYNIFCDINMVSDYFLTDNQPDYCLGVEFIGDNGEAVDVWVDNKLTYFSAERVNGFENGTPDFSINTLSMSKNTISVGSYDSKVSFDGLDGDTYNYTDGVLDQISYFSGYAPLSSDGEFTKPDIVAPGALVVSSVNSYDSETIKNNVDLMSDKVVSRENGREYYWKIESGTSMSAPVVTGIIALWLEADRTLTHDRIKEIFKETAIRDYYVTEGDPRRWGYGKIDAYAGLVKVLKDASVEGVIDTVKDRVLVYDQMGEMFKVFVPSESEVVMVNIYDTAGGLLYSTVADGSDVINVDASGKLGTKGVKIVQIIGSQVNYSTKIIKD